MKNYKSVRMEILKTLYHNDATIELGVKGIDLFKRVMSNDLTPHEFVAQLDYLDNKKMILRKPRNCKTLKKDKMQRLKLAWYSITSYGIDMIEEKRTKIKSPDIQKQIIRIDNTSQSSIVISSPRTSINPAIIHPQSDDLEMNVSKLKAKINEEIESKELIRSIELLITQLRLELSNLSEEQDKAVLESIINRLAVKLKPYKESLGIIGSIASIIGLSISFL